VWQLRVPVFFRAKDARMCPVAPLVPRLDSAIIDATHAGVPLGLTVAWAFGDVVVVVAAELDVVVEPVVALAGVLVARVFVTVTVPPPPEPP
jgi:hypothetical protein